MLVEMCHPMNSPQSQLEMSRFSAVTATEALQQTVQQDARIHACEITLK